MPLSQRESLVLITKTMKMSERDSMEYLKKKGEEMSQGTYYKTLARISTETRKRLTEICDNYKDSHMQHISTFYAIENELWNAYREPNKRLVTVREEGYDDNGKRWKRETQQLIDIPLSPVEKSKILKEIKELQPYISAYEEATYHIMEDSLREFNSGKAEGAILGLPRLVEKA